jgi:hypothetical protein
MSLEALIQIQLISIIPAEAGESGDTSKAQTPGGKGSFDLLIKETDLTALGDSMDGIQGFNVVSHKGQGKARGVLVGLEFWVGERRHGCQGGRDDEGFDEVHWGKKGVRQGRSDAIDQQTG